MQKGAVSSHAHDEVDFVIKLIALGKKGTEGSMTPPLTNDLHTEIFVVLFEVMIDFIIDLTLTFPLRLATLNWI